MESLGVSILLSDTSLHHPKAMAAQQSRLLTCPREVRQMIIFFAYKAYDLWHLPGPVIRIQAVQRFPDSPTS